MPGYLRPQTAVTKFEPTETYIDPVSKIRVSTPSNLIDTDFEYGLQETRWETIELVNNIPTFFSRPGQTPLSHITVTATQNSDIIQVECSTEHNLSIGSPIIVSGLTTNIAEGAFVLSRLVSTTIFEYKAKETLSFAGVTPGGTVEIQDETTSVFGGRLYQATQYKLDTLGSIQTDGGVPSSLTVETVFPHGFSVGTKFILSNTVGGKTLRFDASQIIVNNVDELTVSVEANSTNSSNNYSKYNFVPYDWRGKIAGFFQEDDINELSATINIPSHPFKNGDPVMYVSPFSDRKIPGLSNYSLYYILYVDANTVSLTTTPIDEYNSASPVDFSVGVIQREYSGATSNFGPHALFYANIVSSVVTTSDVVTLSNNLKNVSNDDPVYVFSTGNGFSASLPYKSTNNHTSSNYVTLYVNQPDSVEARETWTNAPGSLDVVSNVFTVASTAGFTNGDKVTYYSNSGTIPTGLTSGQTYNIRVRSSTTFSLHNSRADAIDDINSVDVTSIGTGSSTIIKSNVTLRLATATEGAGILDINGASIDGITWIVVASEQLDNDSVYIENHGLQTDDVVLVDSSGGEGAQGFINSFAIPSNGDFQGSTCIDTSTDTLTLGGSFTGISKVFPLMTTGTEVHLTEKTATTFFDANSGVNLATDQITIDGILGVGFTTGDEVTISSSARPIVFEQANGINISTNQITVSNTEGYVSGQEVIYTSSGDVVPVGLTSGDNYFVRVIDSSTISLHFSKAGAQGNNNTVDLVSRGSGVGGLKPVNSQPGGLTDGGTYYIRLIDINTVSLHNSSGDAISNSNIVNITSSGSGMCFINQVSVALPTGLSNNTSYFIRTDDSIVNPLSFTLHPTRADSISNTNKVNITALGTGISDFAVVSPTVFGISSIDTATEVLTITYGDCREFYTGKAVQFLMDDSGSNPFSSVPSLNVGSYYYVRVIGEKQITLHTTPEKAINNTGSINFTQNTTNANVRFVGNTGPISIGQEINYFVERINENRIRLKATKSSSYQSFLPTEYSSGTMSFTRRSATAFSDSIFLQENDVSEGQELSYSSGINSVVSGLANATTYYAFTPTENHFRISTTDQFSTISIGEQGLLTVDTVGFFINIPSHGFSTLESEPAVYNSTNPIGGLSSGTVYFVRGLDANRVALFYSPQEADNLVVNATAEPPVDQRVPLLDTTLGGVGSLKKIPGLINFTSVGSGTHELSVAGTNAIDGIYQINSIPSDSTFVLNPTGAILNSRTFTFDPLNVVDLNYNAIHQAGHQYYTGAPVVYETSGTVMGGLVSGQTYFVIRLSNNWFRIADSRDNALIGSFVEFTSLGSGVTHSITSSNVAAEFPGPGSVTLTPGSNVIRGSGTNFSNLFKIGDSFKVYVPDTREGDTRELIDQSTGINTTTDIISTSDLNDLSTGIAAVLSSSGTMPGGLVAGRIYYIRSINDTTFTLHPNPIDASLNSNIVDITSNGSGNLTVSPYFPGTVFESSITGISSATALTVQNTVPIVSSDDAQTPISSALGAQRSGLEYTTSTSLYVKGDGFAIHRPYDGGVELTPSTNPDASMVRQTRKYFRYQSGKGIQISKAINFNAPTQIDTYNRQGTTATITTRNPHRLTDVVEINITDAVTGDPTEQINYWNGTFDIDSIVDERTFTITLEGVPLTDKPGGFPQFAPVSWVNCSLKAGLFDDQNGMFFEFDGQKLYAVRRSSVQQLSGTATVTFNSTRISGNNTSFSSQISSGQFLVLKGQSYKVVKVESNDTIYVQPAYRGVSKTNVIMTKTIDTRVPTEEWSLDPCDGTGPSGYELDITKIQMAYIDYSWYGAGKIRFGFKDQRGHVKYFHEFIHNNQFTEAYMRAGNLPARYEVTSNGVPSYVPSIAHWGTSIIMDGEFQDDKAYLFTAAGDQITYTNNDTQKTAPGLIETTKSYVVNDPDTGRDVLAYRITFDSFTNEVVASIRNNTQVSNSVIANENLPLNTKTIGPAIRGFGSTAWAYVDQQPVATDGVTFAKIDSQRTQIDAVNLFTIFTINSGHGMSPGSVHRVRWEADGAVPSTFRYTNRTASRRYAGGNIINGATLYMAPYLSSSTDFIVSTVPPGTGTFPRTAVIASNTRWYTGGSFGSGDQVVIFTNDGATFTYPAVSEIYNVGGNQDLVPTLIPLVSARLAPSVDNSNTGNLGSKEVVNRMQAILNSVGILTNYDCEIYLILNSTLDNTNWTFVPRPSLSQLIKHQKADSYTGGVILYNFRAAGSDGLSSEATTLSLEELATLGNSILGGDGVFPDGPDVLTIAATVVEPGAVTEENPLKISARVSWTESQA
jgi:hypothetical protein